MTPKRKQAAAAAISRIELWVDPLSGLPTQHKIYHVSGETELSIRYLSMKRDDALPASTFMPRWPEGTETVRVE
jgi:outer membrane lipoprotein-sorting protein